MSQTKIWQSKKPTEKKLTCQKKEFTTPKIEISHKRKAQKYEERERETKKQRTRSEVTLKWFIIRE